MFQLSAGKNTGLTKVKKSLLDAFTKSSRRLLKLSRRLFQTIAKTFLYYREDFFFTFANHNFRLKAG
jgi:hypothetical protein